MSLTVFLGVLDVFDGAVNAGNAGDCSTGDSDGGGGDAEGIHLLLEHAVQVYET